MRDLCDPSIFPHREIPPPRSIILLDEGKMSASQGTVMIWKLHLRVMGKARTTYFDDFALAAERCNTLREEKYEAIGEHMEENNPDLYARMKAHFDPGTQRSPESDRVLEEMNAIYGDSIRVDLEGVRMSSQEARRLMDK